MKEILDTTQEAIDNPKQVVLDWLYKTYADSAAHELRDKSVEALNSDDADGIEKLTERLENYIDYHDQKMRDTREDREYIQSLRRAHQFLLDKIDQILAG